MSEADTIREDSIRRALALVAHIAPATAQLAERALTGLERRAEQAEPPKDGGHYAWVEGLGWCPGDHHMPAVQAALEEARARAEQAEQQVDAVADIVTEATARAIRAEARAEQAEAALRLLADHYGVPAESVDAALAGRPAHEVLAPYLAATTPGEPRSEETTDEWIEDFRERCRRAGSTVTVCGQRSPDLARVCILPLEHEQPHPWTTGEPQKCAECALLYPEPCFVHTSTTADLDRADHDGRQA